MRSESRITASDLAELVSRMDEAADAYIRGDLAHYVSLFDHADDYTLMPPYGGETTHGFTYTEQGAAETRRFFASGEATLELEQSYASGDLAVLVRSSTSTVRSAASPTRTGRCASPSSSVAPETGGSWCTGTRTHWCGGSPSRTWRSSPAVSTVSVP